MDGAKSNKRQAVARPEIQSKSAKRQNITMGLDTLDCPICSKPLSPPIFQCPKGNFICSPCREKLPECKRTAPKRCYAMERVVNSIFIRCKHGCATKLTSYQKEEHEKGCPQGPCLCPVSGCVFTAQSPSLLDHLTTVHKLPAKRIRYFVPFDLLVQPGSHVLCGGYGRLFLLNVASLESIGHAVSIVCAQPTAPWDTIECSVGFSCFKGHYQVSSLEIASPSWSDWLRPLCLCVVPKVSGGQTDVVLSITIKLLYGDDEELNVEEGDEDNNYEEEEEEDMTTKWRMVVTELGVNEKDDDDGKEKEDDDEGNEKEDGNDSYHEEDDNMAMIDMTKWVVTITNEKAKEDQVEAHSGN